LKSIKVSLETETNRLRGIISRKELIKNIRLVGNKIFTLENSTCEVLNLLICDDDMIMEYNIKYLNHNYETDIITFRYDDKESDIIISAETVEYNSRRFHTDFVNELYRVIIHGMLHICGYDDDTPYRRRKIRKLENYYLRFLN
jgi:rRNA maturation RNase YbeY